MGWLRWRAESVRLELNSAQDRSGAIGPDAGTKGSEYTRSFSREYLNVALHQVLLCPLKRNRRVVYFIYNQRKSVEYKNTVSKLFLLLLLHHLL